MTDFRYGFAAEECASLRRLLEAVRNDSRDGEYRAAAGYEPAVTEKDLVQGILPKLRQPAGEVMAS